LWQYGARTPDAEHKPVHGNERSSERTHAVRRFGQKPAPYRGESVPSFESKRTTLAMERSTRQRSAIRSVIESAGRPLSPQEVLEHAQSEVPALGMATVYRNLKTLVDEGAITVVTLPGESPRYEPAEHPHHHHFQCTQCRRVFDVHACPGDIGKLAPPGFTVEHHELTLYGLCDECAPPRKPAKPAAGRRR
jgi:Fur family ferric uptake transcriptional regulator